MAKVLLIQPFMQFFENDGITPLAYGKVNTYAAGTLAPKATYTAPDGLTENTNPVILDSLGRARIWGEGSYKLVITDANDVPISNFGTTDNITTFTTLEDAADTFFQSFSGDGSTVSFTLSTDLGTDEKAIMVYIDQGLREYVDNGDFATDTVWTKGSGWSIGSGVATATGAISTAISQDAELTLVVGQSYTVTYTITRDAGSLTASIGGTAGTARSSAGTYSETIIAGATQVIAFTGTAFTGTIDNVSVKQVTSKGYDIIDPNTYTLNGTSLIFTEAPSTGTNNIYVFAPSLALAAASAAAAAAEAAEASALSAAADAEDWATKTDGIVDATDFSSKAYAIGGTGLTTGSAKDWASKAEDSEVTTGLYSALHYAAKAYDSATSAASDAVLTAADRVQTGLDVLAVQDAKLIWQGTYNAGTAYAINDAVTYNGSSFICIQAGTGQTPVVGGTAYWDDLANKGADGSLADGDYTDIVVSGSGTIMTLQPEAITGQTSATIASDDTLVFVDTTDGALKKDTVQGIVDVTTNQLFGGSTVTPDGTELVALDDGTNVTTQSIADLGGGGGITITPQTQQSSTLVSLVSTEQYIPLTKEISDGKILVVIPNVSSSPYGLKLHIETIDTDGTVSIGAETSYTEGTDVMYMARKYSNIIKLNDTKFLVMFGNSTDYSLNVMLVTVDTTTNTVVVDNSYLLLDESNSDGFMTQGAKIVYDSPTTATVTYQSGALASSIAYGRVITLATDTTLSIGSQQTLISNASYNGQYHQGLVKDVDSGDFILTGYNTDTTELACWFFTKSGSTLTMKYSTPVLSSTVFTAVTECTELYTYSRSGGVFGIIAYNDNTTALGNYIPAKTCYATELVYTSTTMSNVIYAFNKSSLLAMEDIVKTWQGGMLRDTQTINNIKYYENDKVIMWVNVYGTLTIYNKETKEVNIMAIQGLTRPIEQYRIAGIEKVRNGQYLVTFANVLSPNYTYFLPLLIEGID